MLDNVEGGEVIFIDPSYVNEFWADPAQVDGHFRRLGPPNGRFSAEGSIALHCGNTSH